MKRVLFPIVAVLLLVLGACDKSGSGGAVQEMKPAPEISVSAISNGAPLKLSDLRGKVVLLNFWATWCPPCREEMPSMMRLNSIMSGKPFQMVTVSIDEGGKPAIDSFFRESGYFLPAYIDPSGAAAKAYGVTGVPESFIIDRKGVLVKKIIGGVDWDSPNVTSFLEGLMK